MVIINDEKVDIINECEIIADTQIGGGIGKVMSSVNLMLLTNGELYVENINHSPMSIPRIVLDSGRVFEKYLGKFHTWNMVNRGGNDIFVDNIHVMLIEDNINEIKDKLYKRKTKTQHVLRFGKYHLYIDYKNIDDKIFEFRPCLDLADKTINKWFNEGNEKLLNEINR